MHSAKATPLALAHSNLSLFRCLFLCLSLPPSPLPCAASGLAADFLTNYAGNQTGCVKCPSSKPHPYGNPSSGQFCCPWPTVHHCVPPLPANKTRLASGTANGHRHRRAEAGAPECCIRPGTEEGCQNVSRCGVNPTNASMCSDGSSITLQDMEQIKGALMGFPIDPVRSGWLL